MLDYCAYLIPWDSIAGLASRGGVFGVACLLPLLFPLWLAARWAHVVESLGRFLIIALLACGLGVLFVLLMQLAANNFYEHALALEAGALHGIPWKQMAAHPKASLAEIGILLAIGGGYALSAVQTALPVHILSFVAGIGVVEEFAKLVVAAFLFHRLADDARTRGAAMALCALSGFAFAAGEALHYFGAYANAGAGFVPYMVRAWMVVPLHMAWAIIGGYRVMEQLGELPKPREMAFHRVILPLMPVILLHGLCDAFILHGQVGIAVVVVIASLTWALSCMHQGREATHSRP